MGFPIYRIYKSTLDGWKQPQPGCFFRTIGNFISYRMKKRSAEDAHSRMRQMLPDGNCARRKCAPWRTLFYAIHPTGRRFQKSLAADAHPVFSST